MRIVQLTGLVGMALVSPTGAQDPTAAETLRGLTGVDVVVEDLQAGPDAERAGLTRSTLQSDIESQLRETGIRVLSDDEWQAAPGRPWLFVRVRTMRRAAGGSGYIISVDLMQRVRLARNPNIDAVAMTWTTGEMGSVGGDNVSHLRDSVRAQVDLFITAYWAVNPTP